MASVLAIVFNSNNHVHNEIYLIVDEAHLLADKTLEALVTEARKRGLFIIGASQSLSEFSSSIRKRLLNNIGVHFLGRHYDTDISDFTRHMEFDKKTIQGLRPFHFMVKVEESSPLVIRAPKGLLGKSKRMYKGMKERNTFKEHQL